MEELLLLLLGAAAVAASPLVPGVRPLAKSAVKGGLALSSAAIAATGAAGSRWHHLRGKVGSIHLPEMNAAVVEVPANTAVVATQQSHGDVEAAESTAMITPPLAETGLAEAATAADDEQTEAVAETETEPAAEIVSERASAVGADDLTRISGIGPKMATILAAAGITTYAQLAAATGAGLREILEAAGPRYRLVDPTSWPDQAGRLLAESAQ